MNLKSKQIALFARKALLTVQKKHLHHDHKLGENNIIAYACVRCNMQITEKRRAEIPVIFHNGSHYD